MAHTDKHFRDLMKVYQPEKSPANFTLNVMNRIYARQGTISEYKPVLNKWFLRAVYAVIGVFLGYAMFGGSESSADNQPSVFDKLFDRLPQINLPSTSGAEEQLTGILGQVPQFIVAIFLSATLLLLLDQLFSKRKKA